MIKIEVTGNSIAEVSDKLLAIGASLQRTVSYDADNAAREALQAKRDAATEAGKPTVGTEAAKRARKPKAVEEKVEVGNSPSSSEPEAPSAGQNASTPAAGEPEKAAEPEEPKKLDFDKEVAPLVLQLVKTKGPEAIKRILDQFGVERASQIEPARYGELVDLAKEAL